MNKTPDSAAVGDVVDVELVGDLTIKDVTQSTTFAATLTYVSANQIEGSATTTIIYSDYGVEVPGGKEYG